MKTVRPFICGEIELFKELGDKKDSTSVSMLLKNKVKELIQIAYDDFKILNQDINLKNNPELYPKPLIRLKVDYSNGFDTINPTTFGREYVDIVANPKDILLFHRKKIVNTPVPESIVKNPIIQPKDFDETSIEQLVSLYLNAQALSILPENKLFEAVDMFVEKDDKDAIKEYFLVI